mmetsp:Transcript_4634/g.21063  ORF Transcript_4634/g.21063 Transcript_4634/m.21063 type:complete len:226 (-) Transcript_4634:850-1527(-)
MDDSLATRKYAPGAGVLFALSTTRVAGSSRWLKSPAPESLPVLLTRMAKGIFADPSAAHAGIATHSFAPTGVNVLNTPVRATGWTARTFSTESDSIGPRYGIGLNASSSGSSRTSEMFAALSALALANKPPSMRSLPSARSISHASRRACRRVTAVSDSAYFLPFSTSSLTRSIPSYRCTSWTSRHILNAMISPGVLPKPFACELFALLISYALMSSLVCSGSNC